MNKILVTLLTIISSVSFANFSDQNSCNRNPVGEEANYELVKGSRTTGLIKKGTFDSEIVEFKPEAEKGPAYTAKLKYDLKVTFVGRHQGEQNIDIPVEFFTREFVERLREEKTIETPQFKVDHLGFEDTETKFGLRYENCDKIKIYDVKMEEQKFLSHFARAMASGMNPFVEIQNNQIENLEIIALRTDGIPVLGAAKVDIKGKAKGYRFKAGFDYKDPNQE